MPTKAPLKLLLTPYAQNEGRALLMEVAEVPKASASNEEDLVMWDDYDRRLQNHTLSYV